MAGQAGDGNNKAGKSNPYAVTICALWTALWLVFTIWLIVGSWSTLETLQAKAAGTTTTITVPTASTSPTAGTSPTASTSPTATPSPTAAPTPSPSVSVTAPVTPGTSPAATQTLPVPPVSAPPGGPEQAPIPVLGWHVTGSLDLGMFLFALAFGGLGATAHSLYYFTGAIGSKSTGFGWDRLGWYGPQPILGAILGGLLYVVIRAGLLSTSSGASAINMFGVAAIGAVGGLSARRAYGLLLQNTFLGDQQDAGTDPKDGKSTQDTPKPPDPAP